MGRESLVVKRARYCGQSCHLTRSERKSTASGVAVSDNAAPAVHGCIGFVGFVALPKSRAFGLSVDEAIHTVEWSESGMNAPNNQF